MCYLAVRNVSSNKTNYVSSLKELIRLVTLNTSYIIHVAANVEELLNPELLQKFCVFSRYVGVINDAVNRLHNSYLEHSHCHTEIQKKMCH